MAPRPPRDEEEREVGQNGDEAEGDGERRREDKEDHAAVVEGFACESTERRSQEGQKRKRNDKRGGRDERAARKAESASLGSIGGSNFG